MGRGDEHESSHLGHVPSVGDAAMFASMRCTCDGLYRDGAAAEHGDSSGVGLCSPLANPMGRTYMVVLVCRMRRSAVPGS